MIWQREDVTLEGVPEGATVRRITVREPTYGGFHGGDPRDFHQDPEGSTDAEKAAHLEACKAWDEGRQEDYERARCLVPASVTTEGQERHGFKCTSGAFGFGTYEIEFDALEVTHPDGRVEVFR